MLREWAVLAKRILATNRGSLEKPFKLLYVITKECHSKCLYCNIWQVKPKNELTLDEIKELARNSAFLSWIDFTGGEPTDRRDFPELVQTFRENCKDLLLIHFPTNGLKTKHIVNTCRELASPRGSKIVVTVSIDGPPEVNDRLRGIPKDFENALETYLQVCQIKGIKSYIGMTLYPENVRLIRETIQSIKKVVPAFRQEDLHLNLPHLSEHYYANDSSSPNATVEMAQAIAQFNKERAFPLRPFQWIERIYQQRIASYLKNKTCPSNCTALLASCYLSETGVVYPCSIWNEPLGNIRDTGYNLLPLLNSPKAKELRTRLLKKDCPNCWTPCEAYPTILGNILRPKNNFG